MTSRLLETAIAAAKAGSAHAASERARNQDANLICRHDVKLKLDVECQKIVADIILANFPSHAILGEEDETPASPPPPSGAFEWVIDPIDGTVNFFHGNPYWCCSVAVRRDGETLAACVAAPDMGLLFQASLDTPALCNGAPIRPSQIASPDLALIHTGADKSEQAAESPFRFFNAIGSIAQRPRVYGAAALDICMTARGSADGYFEPGIYIWDIAAADLILSRAGGKGEILRSHGGHRLAYLATNGLIHAQVKAALEAVF